MRETGSRFSQNSALNGGIAYVTGHGTYLHFQSSSEIRDINAYYGGMFYVEKGATVEVTDTAVKYNEAYEGLFAYVNDRSRAIVHDRIEISDNRVHKRGVFIITEGSQLYLDDATIQRNRIGLDSAIIHAENNRLEYHLEDADQWQDVYVMSWVENTYITKNEIYEEGRMLSIIESNFTITNSKFSINDATTDNYGIYVSYSELVIDTCTFIGPTADAIHYDLNNEAFKDVSGAFLQV